MFWDLNTRHLPLDSCVFSVAVFSLFFNPLCTLLPPTVTVYNIYHYSEKCMCAKPDHLHTSFNLQ